MMDKMFTLDNGLGKCWKAIGFGKPWNGWLTPIVDQHTLMDIFDFGDADDGSYTLDFASDGTALIYHNFEGNYTTRIARVDGSYDLFHLGWCFEAVYADSE